MYGKYILGNQRDFLLSIADRRFRLNGSMSRVRLERLQTKKQKVRLRQGGIKLKHVGDAACDFNQLPSALRHRFDDNFPKDRHSFGHQSPFVQVSLSKMEQCYLFSSIRAF